MQQPMGQTWNGGAPISNGGPGTTASSLATVLFVVQNLHQLLTFAISRILLICKEFYK